MDKLEDQVKNGINQFVLTTQMIKDNIFASIRDTGIAIGAWKIVQDTNNNLIFGQVDRVGQYRFIKTGNQRDV